MLLSRVLKSAFAVMCMATTLACGGVEAEPGEAPEAAAPPAVEVVGSDSATQLPYPTGCGGFREPCCSGNVCNTNLECDPATLRCLY